MSKRKMSPRAIKKIRAWKGWTQEELAAELSVSYSLVTKWETGDRTPRGPGLQLLRQLHGQMLYASDQLGKSLKAQDGPGGAPMGQRIG